MAMGGEWFKHHAMTTSRIFKMGGKWGLQELPLALSAKCTPSATSSEHIS